jgi:hypothetical protein
MQVNDDDHHGGRDPPCSRAGTAASTGRPPDGDAAQLPRLRDVASSWAARCPTCATASSPCTAACSTRCTTAATAPTALLQVARVVGDVMGTTTRTATPRSTTPWCAGPAVVAALPAGRRPGQLRLAGNDPAAAPRYTEAAWPAGHGDGARHRRGHGRFRPNYDGRPRSRLVLPARFPNLLVNGSGDRGRHGHQHPAAQPARGRRGRAVGWSTRRPPRGELLGGADGAHQGSRLPHGRHDRRGARASRTPTAPAAARSPCARSSGRGDANGRSASWSPSCPTR